MASRTLAELPRVRVVDYRCPAERGERPFEERHEAACVSFVRSGSFTYRVGPARRRWGPGPSCSAIRASRTSARTSTRVAIGVSPCCMRRERSRTSRADVAVVAPRRSAWRRFRRSRASARCAHALVAALRGDTACSVEEVALELAAGVLDEQGRSRSSSPGRVSDPRCATRGRGHALHRRACRRSVDAR